MNYGSPTIDSDSYCKPLGIGSIVHSRDFENAVVKMISAEKLTIDEQRCVESFKITEEVQEMVDENIDFATQVSIEASITGNAGYVDMKFVPPTSNTLERFFSKAKFFLGDYRYRITPEHFEAQLFLNGLFPHSGLQKSGILHRVHEETSIIP